MQQQIAPIKDILRSVISKMSGEKRHKVDQIKEAWKEIVDKKLYAHTMLAGFKAKRLVINVDSSAWMYEANLHKEEWRSMLNRRLGTDNEEVKEIVLRIGEIS